MLGLRLILIFIMSYIIIFLVRINHKIFCAGEILTTLDICLMELSLMTERYHCFLASLLA